ncbi:hypothetical protein [Cyclobacterium xiamenense]|uniref:hypothetical protein n=1 Tax=Cyclobacterium xiamenense TaxID=1297121 RepID=UPI001C432A13|nr:hypothetical protein [Cyclobacterium xiamenense]
MEEPEHQAANALALCGAVETHPSYPFPGWAEQRGPANPMQVPVYPSGSTRPAGLPVKLDFSIYAGKPAIIQDDIFYFTPFEKDVLHKGKKMHTLST